MLSVVILTYNSVKFIRPCLDSIFFQDYKNLEVIVVDNSSCDGAASLIKEVYPTVKLIENKKNLGAAKARNQGIEVSHGSWVLTLDCDTILEKDFFLQVEEKIKTLSPEVGMIQPKILQTDGKTIYSTGIYLSFMRKFYDIGKGKIDNGKFNRSGYIFGACAATAFYRREMLDEIKEKTGYFDERFFFLVEDVDLAWRAQRKGWEGVFFSEVRCYHYGNSSSFDRKLRQYLCFRNRYYSIKKNEGTKNYFKKLFPLLFYDFPRLIHMLFFNRYMLRKV